MNAFEISLVTIISIIAFFLIFILPYISYCMAFKRGKQVSNPKEGLDKPFFKQYKDVLSEKIDRLSAIDCKILTITTSDGTKLSARYYHTCDGAPLQIQCHGYRGNPLREFSGGGLVALESNYNVLMIYQRAHGLSEGHAITFGEKERLDVLDWVNYSINELNASSIVLMGISMGAATVLMAS
jgi:predicted alpha/beta-fold hydrolase